MTEQPSPTSPAPPQVSPDGRFYLREGQWVPLAPESAPVVVAVASPAKPRMGAILMLVAAVIAAIGVFSPWITATAPIVGTITRSGSDGDGRVVLAAAAIAVLVGLVVLAAPNRKGLALLVLLAGLACVAVAIVDGGDISSRVDKMRATGSGAIAEIGFGIYLVAIGGLGLIVSSLVTMLQRSAPVPPA